MRTMSSISRSNVSMPAPAGSASIVACSRPSSNSIAKPCTSDHNAVAVAAARSGYAGSDGSPIRPMMPSRKAWREAIIASCSAGRVMSSRSLRNISANMPG